MSPLYVRQVYYEFNTAITGINKNDGKFDENAHREQILPLRGKIMQLDGVNGLNINRYGMTVEYASAVTNDEEVDKTVEEAINWAADQSDLALFPLRGNKTPEVTRQTAHFDR